MYVFSGKHGDVFLKPLSLFIDKEKQNIIEYVKNQQEHHKKETFREEMVRFFKEVGIDIDGQFL